MNLLFIGDIVGQPGRQYLTEHLRKIKENYKIDVCIANGENSAHGNSITVNCARELWDAGVDIITTGNHIFKRDVVQVFDDFPYLIRPANYPAHLPGEGSVVFDTGAVRVGVINLQGRIYMDPLDSPFDAAENERKKIEGESDIIIVDFHAETTSEKGAMGYFLDGKVTAVVGTHTHVQTADEKILPQGTAFISDVGMTGPYLSVLGVDKDIIVGRFARFESKRFELADGPVQFNAVVIDADPKTGKASSITRINLV